MTFKNKVLTGLLAGATALSANARIDEARFNDNFDLHLDTDSKEVYLQSKASESTQIPLFTLPESLDAQGIGGAYQLNGKTYANVMTATGDKIRTQLYQVTGENQLSLENLGNIGAGETITDYSENNGLGTVLTSSGTIWTLNGTNLGDSYCTSTSPVSTTPTFGGNGSLSELVLNYENGSSQSFEEPSATPNVSKFATNANGLIIEGEPLHQYTIEKSIGDLDFTNPATTESYTIKLEDPVTTIAFNDPAIGGSLSGSGSDGKGNDSVFYRAKY